MSDYTILSLTNFHIFDTKQNIAKLLRQMTWYQYEARYINNFLYN